MCHLEEVEGLSDNQYGFRRKDAFAIDAIKKLTEKADRTIQGTRSALKNTVQLFLWM